MKLSISTATLIATCTLVLSTANASAADVGVSISVGQPGFYGRIDINNYPAPAIVYRQPVVIAPPPVRVVQQPVYIYAPPGQIRNWRRFCGRYDACGQPVYFVQRNWYNTVYVPEYRRHQTPYYRR